MALDHAMIRQLTRIARRAGFSVATRAEIADAGGGGPGSHLGSNVKTPALLSRGDEKVGAGATGLRLRLAIGVMED